MTESVTETLIYGPPETGLWCDTCLLPSLVRLPATSIAEWVPSVVRAPELDIEFCEGCGKGLE